MFQKLLQWSQTNFSDLPWRVRRTPYTTLVSEIMLQQTTVATVKNHFERFLLRFPDLESIAQASEEELLVAWKGLGYYRRAKNLKKIAETLTLEHHGEIPVDPGVLLTIPGIGPYTAHALTAIGHDRPALAVDANLERVLSRIFQLRESKGLRLQKTIAGLFVTHKVFQTKDSPRALNEALMDLGRTYCQARRAHCELCPMAKDCGAFKAGDMLTYPQEVAQKSTSVKHDLQLVRAFVVKEGKLLVYEKVEGEWLHGQREVPTFIASSTDGRLNQYPLLSVKLAESADAEVKTTITKYRIKNNIHLLSEAGFKRLKFSGKTLWVDYASAEANLSIATLKGLNALKKIGKLVS